eukprot:TRINITY_DN4042_c0_g1_i12.p1 TRINITY_DN4042_c0_g1~~TRINITY_DN4042_c0_g1_i12.p1  ORF type:complete len:391 (-),score=84.12 TRINITY_DN4042_c0_g1_i12:47-1219(-)
MCIRDRYMGMIDDNSGEATDLRMPTIMISKKDGEIIKAEKAKNKDTRITIQISFEMPTAASVKLDIWINIVDPNTYPMMQEIKGNLSYLPQDSYYIIVNYPIWECEQCALEGFSVTYNKDCLSGGRYCRPDPDNEGPLEGRDVVYEVVNQLCINKTQPNMYWDYLFAFGDRCLDSANYEDCSETVQKVLNIDTKKVKNCIDGSFDGEHQDLDDNPMLAVQKEKMKSHGVIILPTIFINDHVARGNAQGIVVFDSVCEGMETMVSACGEYPQYGTDFEEEFEPESTSSLLVWICVILAVFMVIFFYLYRRSLKREMSREMNFQINSAVSHYLRLNEGAVSDKQRLVVDAQYMQFLCSITFFFVLAKLLYICLLYTSPSPRDGLLSRMPSSA